MESSEPRRGVGPRGAGFRMGRKVGLAARRAIITVVGGVVVVAGLVMLFTPGPGIAGVAAGLAILGTEYRWARRALSKVRERSRAAYAGARNRVQSHRASRRPPGQGHTPPPPP